MDEKFKERFIFKKERVEEKEKYGQNIHVIITCMRHGPKADIGDALLSMTAKEVIKKSLGDFSIGKDGIKVYTSEAIPARCQETGRIISELIGDYRRTHKEIPALTSPFFLDKTAKESLKRVTELLLPQNYEDLSRDERKKVDEQIEEKLVLHFLDDSFPELIKKYEKERRETFPSKIEISHLESAARFAERVKFYIEMSKKLLSDSEINLVNISHTFNLMSFLKETMIFEDGTKSRDLKAKEFLERIGGSIKGAEFFEIDINRKDKTIFNAFLKFRKKKYRLDLPRIEELAKQKSNK